MQEPSQPKPEAELTVATSNTHFGDDMRPPGQADIVLYQEAIDTPENLEKKIGDGYVVHAAGEYGLALAAREGSDFRLVPGSVKTHELGKMGRVERRLAQRWAGRSHEMTAHGMQSAKFRNEAGHEVTVVNTRVTVPAKPIARRRQIRRAGRILSSDEYSGNIIVGGDRNHFPGPKRSDRKMQERANLTQVDLGDQPTWRARHSRAYRALARVRRRPIESYDAQPDVLLHRGQNVTAVEARVVDTNSDHRAIIGRFRFGASRDSNPGYRG